MNWFKKIFNPNKKSGQGFDFKPDEIYLHEDLYCQVEILPIENIDHLNSENQNIDHFSKKHFDGYGFTDIYQRNDSALKTAERNIQLEDFETLLVSLGCEKIKKVYSGYGSFKEESKNTLAYVIDQAAIFCDFKENVIQNIWLDGFRFNHKSNFVSKMAEVLFQIGTKWKLTLNDWDIPKNIDLRNKSEIEKYIKDTNAIPDFLEKYEADLKEYQKECVRITAKPRNEKLLEDNLGLKDSKFLGKPFFPKKQEYPKDQNGKPMVMIAQLNFEQIPRLDYFPSDGILQLFLSPTDWYQDDTKIVYHHADELNEESISDFSFLSKDDYEEMPVFKLHQLSFERDIDNGGSEDSQFDYQFDGVDYWNFTETLTEEQEEEFNEFFSATGHKLGGYAEFTQADPRDYNGDQRDDIQVLQIDVDKHIMFGDSGLGHIFINKESLIQKDFSKAYFYWDCC